MRVEPRAETYRLACNHDLETIEVRKVRPGGSADKGLGVCRRVPLLCNRPYMYKYMRARAHTHTTHTHIDEFHFLANMRAVPRGHCDLLWGAMRVGCPSQCRVLGGKPCQRDDVS